MGFTARRQQIWDRYWPELQQAIDSGKHPRLDTITGFGNYFAQIETLVDEDWDTFYREGQWIAELIKSIDPNSKRFRTLKRAYSSLANRASRPANPYLHQLNKVLHQTIINCDSQLAAKKYFDIVAPNGLIAARGLHTFAHPTLDELWKILELSYKLNDNENYSLNVPVASHWFGVPRIKTRRVTGWSKEFRKPIELIEPLTSKPPVLGMFYFSDMAEQLLKAKLRRYLQNRNLPMTRNNIIGAFRAVSSSVLIIAKIPTEYINSFGNPTFRFEEEIKVAPCLDNCITDIFVLAPQIRGRRPSPEYQPVSVDERRHYCLSYYDKLLIPEFIPLYKGKASGHIGGSFFHADTQHGFSSEYVIPIRTPMDTLYYGSTPYWSKGRIKHKLPAKYQIEFASKLRWYRIY